METDIKSVGRTRHEFMEAAYNCFANGDIPRCIRFIDVFCDTVPDEHPAADELQKAFDQALQTRKSTINKGEIDTKKMNYLLGCENMINTKAEAEIMEINERLDHCWAVAREHGLFNE